MSRSHKHQPFQVICGSNGSAKQDKRIAARSVRRAHKEAIQIAFLNQDFEEFLLPDIYECSHNNCWSWNRDGKQRWCGLTARDWFDHHRAQFDPDYVWYRDVKHSIWPPAWYAEMMRK